MTREAPLTEHDTAERIGTAAMRLHSILSSLSGLGIEKEIRRSRNWPTGLLESLRVELTSWINAISAAPVHDEDTARAVLRRVREELLPYDYDAELNGIAAEFGVEPYDWDAATSE